MGVRFDLSSTNIVAYLTSAGGVEAPRITLDQLQAFLDSLAKDADYARPRIISCNPEWISDIRNTARESLSFLRKRSTELRSNEIVPSALLREVLASLARVLGSYDIYVLPVGSWRDSEVLDRFAQEAARIPGHGILVLIPDYYEPQQNVQVLDPSPATTEALRNRSAWPGAIFMLRSGEANFLPIDEAHQRLIQLAQIMREYGTDQNRLRELVTAPAQRTQDAPTRRLLHLSDLHLGTSRAADTEVYVQTALRAHLTKGDRIVITGDLFDQPKRRYAQQYRNFEDQLRIFSGKAPIIVPGNHDQRIFGNAFFGIGRRLRQLADLRWHEVVIDPDARLAFFCFDSSRTGDLARGSVDRDQLLKMATEYEVSNANRELDGYLKVALVHHHPYPYVPEKETPIIDPRGWPGRESFIEFRDSDRFLAWCASRGVELVLHGHKHIPRLIIDNVPDETAGGHAYRRLTTIGCGSTLGANGSAMSFNIVEWKPGSGNWNTQFMIDRGDGSDFKSAALQSQVI